MTFDWLPFLLATVIGFFLRGELIRQRAYEARLKGIEDEIRAMDGKLDVLVDAFTSNEENDSDAGNLPS